jgi:hypothetical protein
MHYHNGQVKTFATKGGAANEQWRKNTQARSHKQEVHCKCCMRAQLVFALY